jgi:hypothetical protein
MRVTIPQAAATIKSNPADICKKLELGLDPFQRIVETINTASL